MRVLVADRDPVALSQAGGVLELWGYRTVFCRDGAEAWHVLKGPEPPDLAVLDWCLPGIDGPELCRRLRSSHGDDYVYVVLVAPDPSRASVIQGLEAGADDCLSAPVDMGELQARLRTGKRIVQLDRRHAKARQVLHNQATRDALTGVWNRAGIVSIIEREVHRCAREGERLAVVMCDLDHFKRINDSLGHLAGDDVLRETARRILASVRTCDSVGRYGGEEFLCVLPGCGAAEGTFIAERICHSVRTGEIGTCEGRVQMTITAGVAGSDRSFGPRSRSLVAAADAALYDAKRAGRDRVAVADAETAELQLAS